MPALSTTQSFRKISGLQVGRIAPTFPRLVGTGDATGALQVGGTDPILPIFQPHSPGPFQKWAFQSGRLAGGIKFPASREICSELPSDEPDRDPPCPSNPRARKRFVTGCGRNSRVPIREFKSASREAWQVIRELRFPAGQSASALRPICWNSRRCASQSIGRGDRVSAPSDTAAGCRPVRICSTRSGASQASGMSRAA